MSTLSSIPLCPYNGRRVSLRYLPAAARYMTDEVQVAKIQAVVRQENMI